VGGKELIGECVCRGAVETAGFHGDSRNLHFSSPNFCSLSGEAVREKCYLLISNESISGVEWGGCEGRGP
jgi:hypothetical protein